MTKKIYSAIIFFIGAANFVYSQTKAPVPLKPVPTDNQRKWQDLEYYAFVHFSLNTYTDQSWGYGNEDVKLFNPEKLDCRQWARICKEAGMKGIIVTAKHHCGFCLWPSKYTAYSVKNAPWKNGKGDVIRELAAACKEYGLKLGIYLSPWDRNHADYGKPEYIDYFRNQLKELLTEYGPIFEVWFDGANGGSGYYGGANETRKIDAKTYYDWKNTYQLVRTLQPGIVIWNDGGDRGDLRWVGTEDGYVGETNWSLLDSTGDVPYRMLHYGLENGNAWVPAEVNTSIRPEWFYHPREDMLVKTLPQLMETYYNSNGRNASLLLNFPIMPNGLINEKDAKTALEFGAAVKKAFGVNLVKNTKVKATNVRGNAKKFTALNVIDEYKDTYWATDDSVRTATLTIDFGKPVSFNRFMAQEYISLGQRIKSFSIEAIIDGNWKKLAEGTTIGYKRILQFPAVKTSKLRFIILDSKACPVISSIGVYDAPQMLASPAIIRNQTGEITVKATDAESLVFYTLDGSAPTIHSNRYKAPFSTEGKIAIRAIAYDSISGKKSPEAHEKFDITRKEWNIVGVDSNARVIIDGNNSTAWQQPAGKVLPVDLVISLGKEENIKGFKYLPDARPWAGGIISQYQFFVSSDNENWQLVSEGEFSNIKNNPLWQVKEFPPVSAKFIKFRALQNIENNSKVGYAEVDIITTGQ
jgi:alpha-L-fucosidase